MPGHPWMCLRGPLRQLLRRDERLLDTWQELQHDQKDLLKHQGAVEAAERQQCLCQAEEAHPHSPSRQEAEQKRNAPPGDELCKRQCQEKGKASHRLGENICKRHT
ncbi:T-cell acute lymphocytic leukemia protein 2 isoform 3-T3 [Megaptera novaeangliae]